MIPEESPTGELNADEQDSLQVGEQMEEQQEQRLAGKYKNACLLYTSDAADE